MVSEMGDVKFKVLHVKIRGSWDLAEFIGL